MDVVSLLWLFLIVVSLQPLAQRELLAVRRRQSLASLSRKRQATVITLIHRQETMSLLGFPLARFIDIDDAESVLYAIHETPPERSIEIVLHTPGGLVLAATQIASALAEHPAKVTAVVPHYAMSGGTLIALGADEIVMDRHAALGPVDPQIGGSTAASVLSALEWPGMRSDQTLIMADLARKAILQVEGLTRVLLDRHVDKQRACDLARLLATGTWTHDHPLQASQLADFGLPVRIGVPSEERELLRLYPQPRGRVASVEYVPGVPEPPPVPWRRERPPTHSPRRAKR